MRKLLVVLLTAAVLCGGCAGSPSASAGESACVFCMDTVMDLRFWGADAKAAVQQVSGLLYELDGKWSAVREDSLPALLEQSAPEAVLDSQDHALLTQVTTLSDRVGGAFNPQLYHVMALWGFYTGDYRIPTQSELDTALTRPRWDLGGALKGYAGDRAAALLRELSVSCAILNLGGNVQTFGTKADGTPWTVAIRNPADPNGQAGIVQVEGTASIVTSGSYQRYFTGADGVRYHHILDPHTGRPALSDLASVTVICKSGLTADVLSTALFVMGLDSAIAFWRESDDFEAVFILDSGEIYATQGVCLSECDFTVIRYEK